MSYCSHIRITHGSTVILNYGDIIEAPPSFDGGQEVQIAPLVRGEAPAIFPRGNESHTIEFTKSPLVADGTAYTTARAMFDHGIDLPRGKDTVLVEINDATSYGYELQDAVIESWPATHDNKEGSFTVSIVGGKMYKVETAGVFTHNGDVFTHGGDRFTYKV